MTDHLFIDTVLLSQDCLVCRKPFSFPKPDRGRYPQFCSDICRNQRDRQHRNNYAKCRRVQPIIACQNCSKSFKKIDHAIYCSDHCRHEMRLKKRKARPNKSGEHRLHPKNCKACDKLFYIHSDNDKFLCSRACQKLWAKMKRPPIFFSLYRKARGQWEPTSFDSLYPEHNFSHGKVRRLKIRITNVERVSLVKVLKRDGWICQICGEPTPQELRGTRDPRAPEVDHIVPVAKGGRHVYSNLQCACHQCNHKKHAKFDPHA